MVSLIEQSSENIKYGSYPQSDGFNYLPIEYKKYCSQNKL